MNKDDDSGTWPKAAFGSLCVISFGVLLFCLKRLYNHVSEEKRYKPLIIFYCILSVFLVCKRHAGRIIYYLDIAFHYPIWLYILLEIVPLELIFSSTTVISYLWCQSHRREIAIDFSPEHMHSKDTRQKATQQNFLVFVAVNVVMISVYTISYASLYIVAIDQLTLCLLDRVMRIEDITLSLVSSIIIYICGSAVTKLIRDLVHRDPPARFLIVKAVSITSLCLRASVNLVFLILEVCDINRTKDDWIWGLVVFFFYFVIELMLLLVLLALVYTQVNEKKDLKPRGGDCHTESFNTIEIDKKDLNQSPISSVADTSKSLLIPNDSM